MMMKISYIPRTFVTLFSLFTFLLSRHFYRLCYGMLSCSVVCKNVFLSKIFVVLHYLQILMHPKVLIIQYLGLQILSIVYRRVAELLATVFISSRGSKTFLASTGFQGDVATLLKVLHSRVKVSFRNFLFFYLPS